MIVRPKSRWKMRSTYNEIATPEAFAMTTLPYGVKTTNRQRLDSPPPSHLPSQWYCQTPWKGV